MVPKDVTQFANPCRLAYGSVPIPALLAELDVTPAGLTSEAAAHRLAAKGRRAEPAAKFWRALKLFASQFRSPITLMLIAAAIVSIFLEDVTDAGIILFIVLSGAILGFWQEFSASNALAALASMVTTRVTVLRDGKQVKLPTESIVPGDILLLSAGSTIPGDCRLLESQDLFVNESALTGESFPVEKQPGELPSDVPMADRKNVVFQGSHVISGSTRAVVVLTGGETELGKISHRLRLRSPDTDFEHGVRRFSYFLIEVTLLLVFGIFVIHLAMRLPVLDTLLFSLALAVGLTPQLLPAVIAVNLAQGARQLASCKVIVRRLASIEDFGSMNVLCCDKTGTLTEGTVRVEACVDFAGQVHERALLLAGLNAAFETGFTNPIDEALKRQVSIDSVSAEKLDEIPYDFIRKRLSVLVRLEDRRLLIVKGALANVVSICTQAETADGKFIALDQVRDQIEQRFEERGRKGERVIAVAYREIENDRVTHDDESELTFAGMLVLQDPPREGIDETIARLRELGVDLKIVTGDNRIVAASIATQVGLDGKSLLTGSELRNLTDEALMQRSGETSVFAEIEPNQKERIVLALKRSGQVVGYMGDGINDATALHAADVGISVDQAVDVAKEAADIILLEHDLNVLIDGVRQGRATFANTLKYIFLATSANFGNMLSMAGVSLFLPFLPLLPKQILLTNLLTDLPEMTIARDRVDQVLMDQPQRWNIQLIQRFMITFGLLSSVFDFATFGVLLWLLDAGMDEFRTGWFVESVVSACVVVLVVRSRQSLWSSRPARALVMMTLLVMTMTILLPYTPLAKWLGFTPLPPLFLAAMLTIVAIYAASAEFVKRWFYQTLIR
ncbi:magnesium-translocating P-type ATPase [Planctomicrobium sp. SH527]|uniref:magnesium-translocating P-type ATPase n=1 Tax=Planctomicrobium sp. SH527 TaxID=3448123 RepID=UPI003F5BDFB5